MTSRAENQAAHAAIRPAPMREKDFRRIAEYIYENVGIKLPDGKKTMIEARLQKRLRFLGIPDYAEYCNYVFSEQGQNEELGNLINSVTTNTTDFFREPKHFEHLAQVVLPTWMEQGGRGRTLRIWSAGCSTGMEPYTLAMVLTDFAKENSGFQFSILATDISTRALQTALNAVYDEERVHPVPGELKRRYLLRSKNRAAAQVRVVPELRRKVCFQQLNFMQPFRFKRPMDIIFCRNVIIYFDKPTQERLFGKFCDNLLDGGHIFIGHSESLAGMALPLSQVAPTVYRKI